MIVKIIIDSQNRDTAIYDNPFDFSIKLENVFRNVQAIELQDVVVPYMETNQTFVYARIHEIDCRQFILPGNSDKQVRNIEYSLARFQIPGRNSRNLITLNKSSSYVRNAHTCPQPHHHESLRRVRRYSQVPSQ